jgi:hypothetical protein
MNNGGLLPPYGVRNMNSNAVVPRIEFRDLGLIMGLILLVPVAWLLPSALWGPFCRTISALVTPLRRLSGGSVSAQITIATKDYVEIPDARRTDIHVFANRIEQELQYLREYRPGGWNPVVRVAGREYVEHALQSAKGCIFWVAPLFFSSLVAKKGLHGSDIAVTFLSRSLHGPANSKFGERYINVIKARCEERYLLERLATQPGAEIAAIRTLRKCVLDGEPIAIAWAAYGRRLLDAPILAGTFPVASGAPGLAVATGACLLPVFTTRDNSNTFDVVIGPPIPVPEQMSQRDAVAQMVREYSSLLEAVVLNDPAALAIWRYMNRA